MTLSQKYVMTLSLKHVMTLPQRDVKTLSQKHVTTCFTLLQKDVMTLSQKHVMTILLFCCWTVNVCRPATCKGFLLLFFSIFLGGYFIHKKAIQSTTLRVMTHCGVQTYNVWILSQAP